MICSCSGVCWSCQPRGELLCIPLPSCGASLSSALLGEMSMLPHVSRPHLAGEGEAGGSSMPVRGDGTLSDASSLHLLLIIKNQLLHAVPISCSCSGMSLTWSLPPACCADGLRELGGSLLRYGHSDSLSAHTHTPLFPILWFSL